MNLIKRLIFFVGPVVLLLLAILFGFVVFGLDFFSKKTFNEKKEVISYIVNEFNPSTNTSKQYFAQLPRRLNKDDHISYFTPSGSYILISPSTADIKYECSGICLCEDNVEEENERRMSTVISNSLFYLISAVSVVFAMKYARSYFEDQCFRMSENDDDFSCKPEDTKAYMEDCVKLIAEINEFEKKYKEYDGGRWKCRGYCSNYQDLVRNTFEEIDISPSMKEDIEKFSEFYREEQGKLSCEEIFTESEVEANSLDAAILKFSSLHLEPLCRNAGMVEVANNILGPRYQQLCIRNGNSIQCHMK